MTLNRALDPAPDRVRHARGGLLEFAAWTLVGAGTALALLTPMTIGPFVALGVLVVVAALLRWRGRPNCSVAGLLSGAGLIPLYVAYLNRGGPGEVCSAIRDGQECADEWSPWPWLAVGVLLVTAGAGLFAVRRTRRRA
jgi:hypothetical protein